MLSIIFKHYCKHDSGTICAYNDNTSNENKKRSKNLKAALLGAGYSVTDIDGVYIVIDIQDIGNLKNMLIFLGKNYEQKFITFSTASDNRYVLIDLLNNQETFLDKPMFNQSGELYSEIDGRPFVFNVVAKLDSEVTAHQIDDRLENYNNSSKYLIRKIYKEETANFVDVSNEDRISKDCFIQREKNGEPIIIVSASRIGFTNKENDELNKELRSYLKKTGFGHNRVKGKYIETVVDKDGEEKEVVASDDSCIVYAPASKEKELLALGIKLGKKYEQDSIFFMGTDGKAELIATRPDSSLGGIGKKHTLGNFHVQKDSDVLTQIRGKSYTFDWEKEVEPSKSSGMNEAMVRKAFMSFLLTEKELDEFI